VPHSPAFTAGNLFGSILFSSIGFVAFRIGKRDARFEALGLGTALMLYSYFMPNAMMTWLVGAGLTVALYFFND